MNVHSQTISEPRAHVSLDVDATQRWPLTRMQRWAIPLLAIGERGCEILSRLLRRPHLSPRRNTQRCYERLLDPLCADTGLWPDYTEGYYPRGDESYAQAKLAQFDFILDRTGAGEGSRLLDMGCGNGKLLQRARDRGCDVSGVTISRTQARYCGKSGLDVRVCSFDAAAEQFEPHSFDVIVLNGSTEHFVGEDAVVQGRDGEVREALFETLSRLLRPGGRVFITCIHFRWASDVHAAMGSPLRHPVGSYDFHNAVLRGVYSGWYPEVGDYERAARRVGLELEFEQDATADYLQTSQWWKESLDRFCVDHPLFVARYTWRIFWDDPRYFFLAFLYWLYASWSWQFRPTAQRPAPMVHRWLMFQSRTDS